MQFAIYWKFDQSVLVAYIVDCKAMRARVCVQSAATSTSSATTITTATTNSNSYIGNTIARGRIGFAGTLLKPLYCLRFMCRSICHWLVQLVVGSHGAFQFSRIYSVRF